MVDWRVHEFARAIYPLVHKHFSKESGWMVKVQSFGFMVEQRSEAANYQHGDTYLSPALSTAVRYAVNKRFGSELLTYSLDFLDELIRRQVPGVSDDLYRQYPDLFRFLDISCAPLLVEASNVLADQLVDEHGGDPEFNLSQIARVLDENGPGEAIELQQTNFRLRSTVPVPALRIWLINVAHWHPFSPQYTLCQLDLTSLDKPSASPQS